MHSSSHPSKPNQAKQYRRCWSPSWARSTRGKNREFKGKDRLQKNGKDGDQNYKFFPDFSSCYGLLIYISILWQHVFDMADFSVLLLYSLKSNNNNVMKEKKRSNLVILFPLFSISCLIVIANLKIFLLETWTLECSDILLIHLISESFMRSNIIVMSSLIWSTKPDGLKSLICRDKAMYSHDMR